MKLKHLELFCNPTTKDKSTMMDLPLSDDSDSKDDSSDEEHAIKHPKLTIEKDNTLKGGIQRLCNFICSLEQPEKLDVHIITSDTLSSSEEEAVERLRELPALNSLSVGDTHWSLYESFVAFDLDGFAST